MLIIGAHVSTAGALHYSFNRAHDIGAQATQIFISPPQQWAQVAHSDQAIAEFLAEQKATGITPTVIHGAYLINLATDNPANLEKGISWLKYSQKTAARLNILGTIFHLGSHKGRGFDSVKTQVCKALEEILAETPENVLLMLENSAGAGGSVGGKLSELGELIKTVNHPQLAVCLDTQHAFVSGYDLRTPEGVEQLLTEFEQHIGLDKLAVIHCNDSKTEFNSGRDRHENLGEGFIGKDGFAYLINHPTLQDVPFILEVPGFEDDGPDKENVDFLKSLVSK